MLEHLYRQLVMDHYKHPRNSGKIDGPGIIRLPYRNPTCGDAMVLYSNMVQESIADIRFEGSGCSISMASCSMMTSLVRGKPIAEARLVMQEFEEMIKNGIVPQSDNLQDALSLAGVHALKGRHNCALMGWQALEASLQVYMESREQIVCT